MRASYHIVTFSEATCYSQESCLKDDLFAEYDSTVRPVADPSVGLNVTVSLHIRSLTAIVSMFSGLKTTTSKFNGLIRYQAILYNLFDAFKSLRTFWSVRTFGIFWLFRTFLTSSYISTQTLFCPK